MRIAIDAIGAQRGALPSESWTTRRILRRTAWRTVTRGTVRGSARAVVVALLSRGARVSVHARRPEQAMDVTGSLGAEVGEWPVPPGSWDLLVNCTPLGGAARRDESPLPGGPFTGRLVYDLTYGPGESVLQREAREAGCVTLDGLPMLIAQAGRQFEWWTGQAPAPGVMREAAHRKLNGRANQPSQATESRGHGVSS